MIFPRQHKFRIRCYFYSLCKQSRGITQYCNRRAASGSISRSVAHKRSIFCVSVIGDLYFDVVFTERESVFHHDFSCFFYCFLFRLRKEKYRLKKVVAAHEESILELMTKMLVKYRVDLDLLYTTEFCFDRKIPCDLRFKQPFEALLCGKLPQHPQDNRVPAVVKQLGLH